ncbi:MAG: hypothetical protein ACRDRM_07890 [Pseudonocardiaceae bacterium]
MTTPHSAGADTTRKVDLSVTQIVAAALAAVTAAVLGSELGAAGTVIGAAGASVIVNVGTVVYRASLERSREKIRVLARSTLPLPTSRDGSRAERSHSPAANAPLDDERLTDSADDEPQPGGRSRRFITLRWGAVVVGAVGSFVLAMMAITGFEGASGKALGGNGEGTTFGRLIDAPPGPPDPADPLTPSTSNAPTSEVAPTETTAPSISATTTTTPDGGASVERSRPSQSSETPRPSTVRPPPSLIPTVLPGPGDRD